MIVSDFVRIEKEQIENLRFPSNDVLQDDSLIQERTKDLERALSLGNLEHSKIKIFFEDAESLKFVETTVWAVTDKQVILKQRVGIPINRIHTLQLY